MSKVKMRIASFAPIFLLIISCNDVRLENVSAELQPQAGATKVKHAQGDGFERISYVLAEPFPPRALITQLCSRAAARGWHPLLENAFNPEDRGAYSDGWRKRVVASGADAPRRWAYIWWSQWQRDDGAVLNLSLSYEYPRDAAPDLSTLYVDSSIDSRLNQRRIDRPKFHRLPLESQPVTDAVIEEPDLENILGRRSAF